jgi:hypothetical protein
MGGNEQQTPLLQAYNNPETSGLATEVTAQSANRLPPFELNK